MKATHKGTCQCCGNIQKLPNGLLSQHGYTVDYGFFNGVCFGSKNEPFELDNSLIQPMIDNVKEQIENVKERIENIQNNTDINSVYNKTYRNHKYIWEKRAIKHVKKDNSDFLHIEWVFNDDEKPRHYQRRVAIYKEFDRNNLVEAAKMLNNMYIDNVLKRTIKGLEDYVLWQEGRLKNWKVQDLIEL